MLRGLAETLTWQHNSSFLIQLTFMLGPFLEEVTSSGGHLLSVGICGRREGAALRLCRGSVGPGADAFLHYGCRRVRMQGERKEQRGRTVLTGPRSRSPAGGRVHGEPAVGGVELGGHGGRGLGGGRGPLPGCVSSPRSRSSCA